MVDYTAWAISMSVVTAVLLVTALVLVVAIAWIKNRRYREHALPITVAQYSDYPVYPADEDLTLL